MSRLGDSGQPSYLNLVTMLRVVTHSWPLCGRECCDTSLLRIRTEWVVRTLAAERPESRYCAERDAVNDLLL